jgi:zinc protease
LTIDDARSFYKRYYAPNRAVLVLAGDVTINDAKRLAKRWFADLTPAADGASAPIDDTVLPRTHYRLQREMPQIATPRVMIEHVAPSFSKDRKEAFALTLFAAYLGDGDNSYLNKNLVRTEKVLAAEAGYNGLRRGRGTFYAAAIPLAGTQADAAEDLLKQTLRNALKDFSARDLEKEKAKIAASLVYVNDNPEETAMMVGQFAALGFSLDEIESYADGLQQVGLGEVKEAVRRLLDDASSVTGVLLPLSSAGQEKK